MEFLFSCSTRHLSRSLRFRALSSQTLEEKFDIYARPCIIFYLSAMDLGDVDTREA